MIYDADIVKPLFETVAALLDQGGSFIMTQSFVYDAATEARIDKCIKTAGLEREVLRSVTFVLGCGALIFVFSHSHSTPHKPCYASQVQLEWGGNGRGCGHC